MPTLRVHGLFVPARPLGQAAPAAGEGIWGEDRAVCVVAPAWGRRDGVMSELVKSLRALAEFRGLKDQHSLYELAAAEIERLSAIEAATARWLKFHDARDARSAAHAMAEVRNLLPETNP
jgi:hypothetical protein